VRGMERSYAQRDCSGVRRYCSLTHCSLTDTRLIRRGRRQGGEELLVVVLNGYIHTTVWLEAAQLSGPCVRSITTRLP